MSGRWAIRPGAAQSSMWRRPSARSVATRSSRFELPMNANGTGILTSVCADLNSATNGTRAFSSAIAHRCTKSSLTPGTTPHRTASRSATCLKEPRGSEGGRWVGRFDGTCGAHAVAATIAISAIRFIGQPSLTQRGELGGVAPPDHFQFPLAQASSSFLYRGTSDNLRPASVTTCASAHGEYFVTDTNRSELLSST